MYVPAFTTTVSPGEAASTAAWIDSPGWTTCVAARADAGDPNVNPAIRTPAKVKALLSNWRMAPPSSQMNRISQSTVAIGPMKHEMRIVTTTSVVSVTVQPHLSRRH